MKFDISSGKNTEQNQTMPLPSFPVILCLLSAVYGGTAAVTGFNPLHTVTGIPAGIFWLFVHFFPSNNTFAVLPVVLKTLVHTSIYAVTATTAAAGVALCAALAGSRTTGRFIICRFIITVIAAFFRNIPLPTWSMILLLSFKQSNTTGVAALFFITLGHLTRAFTEIIDSCTDQSYTALKAAGVPKAAIIVHAVIPSTLPLLISWLLYAIETNIRDSALIGILTGTGIGFLFNLYFKSFRYHEAGLIICTLLITVLSIDMLSNKIRRILL